MPDVLCDRPDCPSIARWKVYAAYDSDTHASHPLVARYPQPIARTCGMHLPLTLGRDAANISSTRMWVVQPL